MPSRGPPDALARGSQDAPPPPPARRLIDFPRPPPPRPKLTAEVDDADEAERDRQAQVTSLARGLASKRSATAKLSSEEVKERRNQREAATASKRFGAATAHLVFAERARTGSCRAEGLVLQSPHEAGLAFHEDWTRVDNEEEELKLRDSRNRLIHLFLVDGRSVFYRSSGNSMWPLVQSDDACTFHPIQAVSAGDGEHDITKDESEIDVGDIVFCQVQRSQQYYAHIVLRVERDYYANEVKYWIGNIQNRYNGWCYREHIFGILVKVQVLFEGQYYTRPFPKRVFNTVRQLVKDSRWSEAAGLCEPSRE